MSRRSAVDELVAASLRSESESCSGPNRAIICHSALLAAVMNSGNTRAKTGSSLRRRSTNDLRGKYLKNPQQKNQKNQQQKNHTNSTCVHRDNALITAGGLPKNCTCLFSPKFTRVWRRGSFDAYSSPIEFPEANGSGRDRMRVRRT